MNNTHCSPKNKDNLLTCFSNESLVKIAKKYNNSGTQSKIDIPKKILDIDEHNLKNREYLWKQIKSNIKGPCKEDYCLLYNKLIKDINDDEITKKTFRPVMPKSWNDNIRAWLSTIDILKVMRQYQDLHKDFMFIGPTPIDFEKKLFSDVCVSDDICKMDLSELYNEGKRKIGIIINLDPHYKGGSHWVSLYVDIVKGGIYFFDSYGLKPKKEIFDLMEKIKIQGNKLIKDEILDINDMLNEHIKVTKYKMNDSKDIIYVDDTSDFYKNDLCYVTNDSEYMCQDKKDILEIKRIENNNTICLCDKISNNKADLVHKSFKCFYNPNKFQYKNSECGVYSMHFIEQFLNGKNFNKIISNPFSDDEINKKRFIYYRPNL